MVECTRPDGADTARDSHGSQSFTPHERPVSNDFDTAGDGHGGQGIIDGECIESNGSDGAGDGQ